MTEVIERPVSSDSKAFPKKKCTVCSKYWQPEDRYQSARTATCSKECSSVLISRARQGKGTRPTNRVTVICPVCETPFERPLSHILRVAIPVCSRKCNGHYRGKEWGSKKNHKHSNDKDQHG